MPFSQLRVARILAAIIPFAPQIADAQTQTSAADGVAVAPAPAAAIPVQPKEGAEATQPSTAAAESPKPAAVAPAPSAPPLPGKNAPPVRSADTRSSFRSIIARETAQAGMPAHIAEAVMEVESGGHPEVIGAAGEIGLMQVMPPTARMLGFSGSLAELAQPEVNLRLGVRYLAQAWRLSGGDLCTAVMKYRAGHGETRFSQKSVDYCLAVRSRLAARGVYMGGVVPVATFGEPSRQFTSRIATGAPFVGPPPRSSLRFGPAPCRSNCLAALGGGRPNFDQINDSLNHLVLQSNVRAIRLR